MTEATHRRRIRASFEAGKCIWPACYHPVSAIYLRQRFLCDDHVEEVARSAKHPQKSHGDLAEQFDAPAREAAEVAAAHPGWIYYLRLDGHYKIGWAKRLEQRLKAYSPGGVVLAVHEGSRKDEAALHRRFAHLTSAGREWYPLVPDITRHVAVVVEQHGAPSADLHCGPAATNAIKVRLAAPVRPRGGPAFMRL